jgi:hypothetical protein
MISKFCKSRQLGRVKQLSTWSVVLYSSAWDASSLIIKLYILNATLHDCVLLTDLTVLWHIKAEHICWSRTWNYTSPSMIFALMSVNNGHSFSFQPPALMSADPLSLPHNSDLVSLGFSSFSSNASPLSFVGSPSPSLSPAILDALTVDTLAKDFQLEPVQHANLQAFVKVNEAFIYNSQVLCAHCFPTVDGVTWWDFDSFWSIDSDIHARCIVFWGSRASLCCSRPRIRRS